MPSLRPLLDDFLRWYSSTDTKRRLLLLAVPLALASAGLGVLLAAWTLGRGLPPVDSLKSLQLQVPLKVFSADGKLIGEFGAERRALIKFADVPPQLIEAFLAAEDDDFFEHSGVDYFGLLRAALKLAATGDKAQGGSTITMQLARNVFLSSEKTFTRKFREILLARKIEGELSKEEILELYLNKIYLGERAYGIGAAALIYFGKSPADLELGEMATLAALPKAPSRDNPVANPAGAMERRNYVLRRMRDLGYIDAAAHDAAAAKPIAVRPYKALVEIEAHYAAEMVRAELYSRHGEEIYTRGFVVTTTLNSSSQLAATAALRRALQGYDERHGWRGAQTRISAEQMATADSLQAALSTLPEAADLEPAVVIDYQPEVLRVATRKGPLDLGREAFQWANFSSKKAPARGDVVYVRGHVADKAGARWKLAQVPEVQGAFVALRPRDGAIQALVGGYDFWLSNFNHVSQARRQAGSGFKPFLYAAALAQGHTPASVFLDAPIVFDDPGLESSWRPENYDSDFNGPMRLREALVQSRNLVSIRLLQALGLDTARQYVTRFGFDAERLPKDLTIALGSAAFTPLEMARAYAVLANGGFAVEPYLIDAIRDPAGEVVFKAEPKLACPECSRVAVEADPPVPDAQRAPRTVEAEVAWLMTSMLRDVTIRGTAAAVGQLGRSDLAGKTGTTNDETDAWFNGYQKNLVGIAWVGFDQPQPLGRGEVGGKAALPIWTDFMKSALKGVPQENWPRPGGLVEVRINPQTGKLAAAGDPDAVHEVVQQDHIPEPDDPFAAAQEQPAAADLF